MTVDSFWRGRRIFVTGHTGFKGSWLTQWLLAAGAKVKGYALSPPTEPSLFEILCLGMRTESCVGDVRDFGRLSLEMEAFSPEVVFHLAAQPLVIESYKSPLATYETNILGTANVLEAARKCPRLRSVVCATTDKCYENREWSYAYREIDALGGYDPYSSSKACAEIVTGAYRTSFFNPQQYGKGHTVTVSTVRAGNVIGGGDWAENRLIPDVVRALSKGEAVELRSPSAVRPWQHVLEPIGGYLWLAEQMYTQGTDFGQAWNFGPNDVSFVSVKKAVSEFIDCWGSGEYRCTGDAVYHEAQTLRLDVSKARSELGWFPCLDLRESIEMAARWYRAFLDPGSDLIAITNEQIQQYIERARQSGLEWAGR